MPLLKRACALMMALVPMTSLCADTVPADRADVEAREVAIYPAAIRDVSSAHGIVSGTASPIAVEAGAQVLRDGGTAADAAITTALAQVTTMLGANVSVAGVLQLVYYEARTGRVQALDAGWGTWRNEHSPATIPTTDLSMITGTPEAAPIPGAEGRKVLVPGFMAGIEAMHRRFGKLPMRRLVAPAIHYAENGVPVTGLLSAYLTMGTAQLLRTQAGRRFVMSGGAHLPRTGDRFYQPQLAALYRTVARQGARRMYRGAWARHFVDVVREAGGVATMSDLRAYAPLWGKPQTLRFGDVTVIGPDATNRSSCAALEALNLIGHAKAQDAVEALYVQALALRVAQFSHFGPAAAAFETGHDVGGSCQARIGAAYGAAASAAMETMLGGGAEPAPQGHHSASVVAVDRWGNVAALVHSSNTPLWGDSGLVVDGIPLPAPASTYRFELTRLAPGARVPSEMAPLIVEQDGKPAFAVAAIGSSVVPETVRLVAALSARTGQTTMLSQTLGAPPLLLNYEDQTSPMLERAEYVPAGRYPADVLRRLRLRGLRIREVEGQRVQYIRGTAAVATIADGARHGAEAPGVFSFVAPE